MTVPTCMRVSFGDKSLKGLRPADQEVLRLTRLTIESFQNGDKEIDPGDAYFALYFLKSLSRCIDSLKDIARALLAEKLEKPANAIINQADFLNVILTDTTMALGIAIKHLSSEKVDDNDDLSQRLFNTFMTLQAITEQYHFHCVCKKEGLEAAKNQSAQGLMRVAKISEQQSYFVSYRLAVACQAIGVDSVFYIKLDFPAEFPTIYKKRIDNLRKVSSR